MSAPLRLTGEQMQRVGAFLTALSHTTRQHQVWVAGHGPLVVQVPVEGDPYPASLEITWDVKAEAYVVDDRVGS